MTNSLCLRHLTTRVVAALAGLCVASTGLVVASAAPAGAATADAVNSAPVTSADNVLGKSNTLDLAIPSSGPASTYPSTITYLGVPGAVTDVSVRLTGVTHTHLDDLDVMLVSPDGRRAMVLSDAGGTGVSGRNLFFNDAVALPVEDSTLPAGGSFRPTNYGSGDVFPAPAPDGSSIGHSFGVFQGASPNGQWKLFVNDDASNDTGVITGWDLMLRTDAPVQGSSITVSGTTGPVTDVDLQLHGVDAVCPDDFDMLLVGPQGQQAMVFSDAAGCDTMTARELVLDDEAAQSLPLDDVPAAGTYRPVDSDRWTVDYDDIPGFASPAGVGSALSAFDGGSANGTWTLYVVQDAPGTYGHLGGGWGLHITTADQAAPATQPAPAITPATTPATSPAAPPAPSDATAPRVGSSTPKKAATGVQRAAVVKAVFTERMHGSSVTSRTVRLTKKGSTKVVKATVTYVAKSRTVVLDPAARLAADTTYRLVVTTGTKDVAGNSLDQNRSKSGAQAFTTTFRTR